MHNQRNRRAARAKAPRGTAPLPRIAAFPSDVALPPHRGAIARMIDQPLPPAALASAAAPLFAMPARPAAAKSARRKTPKRKAAKRKTAKPKLIRAAAITLPDQPEPLVTSGHALVPYRADGLMGQLSHWLTGRIAQAWNRLGGQRQSRPGSTQSALKMRQLRAENAHLKAQLEALLALQHALPPGAHERALQPVR